MSSLWTPGGEHPVDPERSGDRASEAAEPAYDDLTPEQQAQAQEMAAEMAEVRRQLAEVPASVVVANHVMGLYELAAIHLSAERPRLDDARLAIDAMAAVVEGLPNRLGEHEPVLRDALNQVRLAFVQVRNQDTSAEPD